MHLKNVDPTVRARVLDGSLAPEASYAAGVMCQLPDGVVDIRAVMRGVFSFIMVGGVSRSGRRAIKAPTVKMGGDARTECLPTEPVV